MRVTRVTQIIYGSVGTVISGDSSRVQFSNGGAGPMVVGNGVASVQERGIHGAFEALEINGPVSVEFTRSPACTLAVTGEANLLDFVETVMSGTTLLIGVRPEASFATSLPLKVIITGSAVLDVQMVGTGDVSLSGLDQEALAVKLRGTGSLRAKGAASSVKLKLQGSGDIDTRELMASKVAIKLLGTGDVRLWAKDEARIRLLGTGDVVVAGQPAVRDVEVLGTGDVRFL